MPGRTWIGDGFRFGSFLCCRYRGEGIVNGPPEHVWDFVKPLTGSLREQWDENVTSFEIIQSVTDVSLARWLAPPPPCRGSGTPWGEGSPQHTPGAQQTHGPGPGSERCDREGSAAAAAGAVLSAWELRAWPPRPSAGPEPPPGESGRAPRLPRWRRGHHLGGHQPVEHAAAVETSCIAVTWSSHWPHVAGEYLEGCPA